MQPNVVRFGGIAEGIVMPAIRIGRDAHRETECGHGGALSQRDECTASFMRGAYEAHTVRAFERGTREHHEPKPAGAKQ